MKKISFLAIELVLAVQVVVLVMGAVCAVYLIYKIWTGK
jgi:hypothetical protein